MNAHELARILLDGPDVPVVAGFGKYGDLDEITNAVPADRKWWPTEPPSDAQLWSTEPAVELT